MRPLETVSILFLPVGIFILALENSFLSAGLYFVSYALAAIAGGILMTLSRRFSSANGESAPKAASTLILLSIALISLVLSYFVSRDAGTFNYLEGALKVWHLGLGFGFMAGLLIARKDATPPKPPA